MDIFLQQIVNGVTLGSIYALVALGYTMVYGIIGLINFAHGEVVMIGALTAFSVITGLLGAAVGLPVGLVVALGLATAVLVCTVLAFSIEKVAYRPLRRASRLAPLITAIGMSIVLQNVAMMIWGRNYLRFPELFGTERYVVGGASITSLQIAIVLLAAGLTAAATNLDGWIVSAFKVAYFVVNVLGWTASTTAGALLTSTEWLLGVLAYLVSVVSVPGRWVRAKAFRAA